MKGDLRRPWISRLFCLGTLVIVSMALVDVLQDSTVVPVNRSVNRHSITLNDEMSGNESGLPDQSLSMVPNRTDIAAKDHSIPERQANPQNTSRASSTSMQPFRLLDRITDSFRTRGYMAAASSNLLKLGQAACNCLTLPATTENDACCLRLVSTSHKMGLIFTMKLFRNYTSEKKPMIGQPAVPKLDRLHQWDSTKASVLWSHLRMSRRPVTMDFRNVLMMRNIYDALASGYLYHLTGRECWLDTMGNPYTTTPLRRILDWQRFTSLREEGVSLIRHNKTTDSDSQYSLCDYLAEHSESDGMRVYIEWVFRYHFLSEGSFAQLAHASQYKPIRKRTMVVCYAELITNTATVTGRILDFVFPGGHGPFQMPSELPDEALRESLSAIPGRAPSTVIHRMLNEGQERELQASGHATDHDPMLRARLKTLVEELDRTLYNGQIAWLDSIIPC